MGRRLNTDHDKPFRYTERYTLNARVPLPGDADSEIKPAGSSNRYRPARRRSDG
jgi:hypothetical protein